MTRSRRTVALCLALLLLPGLPIQTLAEGKIICSPRYASSENSSGDRQSQEPQPFQSAGQAVQGPAAQVMRKVNEERIKAGLTALREDPALTQAACTRAREIVRKFSHTRPDGSAWSSVSARAFGENIAMGQRTADKVMAAWLTSPGHRANILRASFGSIGVCCLVSGGVTYWVQLFGK